MSFVGSNVFRSFVFDALGNTAAYDLDTDAAKAALYGTTPDNVTARDDTTAHNVYAAVGGQWIAGSEKTGGGGTWAAGGTALASNVQSTGAGFVMYDAADVAPGGTNTLAAVFGCLVYDTTVGNNGICCNYFGGSQSVTAGTFTIVWNANGIFRATM